MKLILASSSPRRHELLAKAGLEFTIIPSPAEEIHDPSLGMACLCETNAKLKATAVSTAHPHDLVIGADTLVFLDGDALGKPKSLHHAREMLRRLSGRTHQVCTGVCLAGPGDRISTLHRISDVTFLPFDEETINRYIDLTQPLDKAGSYGIQDHTDMIIDRIEGDFDNVMGLPVTPLLAALQEIGLPVPPE